MKNLAVNQSINKMHFFFSLGGDNESYHNNLASEPEPEPEPET